MTKTKFRSVVVCVSMRSQKYYSVFWTLMVTK